MLIAVGEFAVGIDHQSGLKGKPPPRPVPDDFDVIFIEQGRDQCESWYRASKRTVNRWLDERGKERLIAARADYVKHQRGNGRWITRSTRMVEHREIRALSVRAAPIRDRRKVSFTVARHAAQYLRIRRNGGWIVSPAGKDEWWLGTRRVSAAQMVDLAKSKGFDAVAALQGEHGEGVN
ncbi:MAG: hypothetical protein ACR652_17650 [Methylocystis sp.]|uniref:hypothetical protein n=1 Tax=Methylocystis sp. TaxID=1911079 RepID=UPI003DA4E4B5